MLWPKLSTRLAHRDVEDLLEQPDLGQLHRDDRAVSSTNVSSVDGSRARTRAARSTFFSSTSPQTTDARSSIARTTGP